MILILNYMVYMDINYKVDIKLPISTFKENITYYSNFNSNFTRGFT